MKGIVTRFSARRHGVVAQDVYPILKVKSVQLLFTEKVLSAISLFDRNFKLQNAPAVDYNNELSVHLDEVFELFLKNYTAKSMSPVNAHKEFIIHVKPFDEISPLYSDLSDEDFGSQIDESEGDEQM